MAPATARLVTWTMALGLGSLSACTAWQYDIEPCDPKLGLAACQRVNLVEGVDVSPQCASIYQCNKSTLNCELSPKDVDQDGDLPLACGGTDCNENDARYSGVAQTCGCNLAGQPCKAGKGACVTDLTTECVGGGLSCPDQQAPKYRDTAWRIEPFTAGSLTSWDWNCNQSGDTNENSEKNCAYDLKGQALPCTPTMCSDEVNAIIAKSTNYAKDAGAVCAAVCNKTPPYTDFCKPFTSPEFELNCGNKCGDPLFRCRCVVMCPNFNCNTCGLQAVVAVGAVSCR